MSDSKVDYEVHEVATLQEPGKLPTNWKSRGQWLRWVEACPTDGLSSAELYLFNKDLKPVESARRRWRWYNYVFLWIADAVNVNSWQIAATGMVAGLTWWETWLAVWVGYFISGMLIQWTARVGAFAHICFPVACRASFGVYGSLWPIINRVVMAIIWYSVQSWIFGQCVQVMLQAIFNRDLGKPGHPLSAQLSGTTSFEFLSFFLAWLVQLPAIWFPPQTIRHLFTFKAVVSPTAAFAFLIWALVKSKGAGSMIDEKDVLPSSQKGWQFVYMVMNCVANYATLVLNSPDFSRLAHRPSAALWPQGLTIPIAFSVTSLIGLLVSSCSKSLYGEVYWSPLDVLRMFMTGGYTAGDRAGAFLIAFGLAVAQLGTNICANSLSAGTDMTALLPRFITIRRGGYVCAIISLCICPWNFFNGTSNFTSYLSAYSVFLSSITGVIMADYCWLRHGKLVLRDLYTNDINSIYMYGTRIGCNWRAYAAYLLALVPNMPGFVGQTGHKVPQGATYLYYLNYFVGFLVSFILYIVFNMISAPGGVPEEVKGRQFSTVWLEEDLDVENFEEDFRAIPITSHTSESLHSVNLTSIKV